MGLNLEPDAAAQLQALSPESVQHRTFEVVGELLQRMAANRPLVIALDDLHWADPTSLALTERLLALTEMGPVMLAMSQRPETDHPSWVLKERAAREYRHLFRELALQPLGQASEAQLLSALAEGRTLPATVTDRLLDYAGGNPFYLEQILRSLIDSGTLLPQDGHWILTAPDALEIPQTVEGVIIARIDRLEGQWREVLTSASVLGRSFGLALLEAVTRLPVPALRQSLHHLLRLDLFREESGGTEPTYRFKHALIQDAAYHTLVGPVRSALHRRAAEWYETYYADRLERVYGLIAHHWLETDDRAAAARYLKLAGDRALAEWALDEAVGHFGALVPLLQAAGRRHEAAETLFEVATALHLAMRYREANETWRRAFAEWNPPDLPAGAATAALRIAATVIPSHVDPAQAGHTPNVMLLQQLYPRLLGGRPGPYVVPALAVRWEVSDAGRRYRLELDPNARWNEGGAVTAGDLVEGYRTVLDPKLGSLEAPHLSPLENADAYAAGKLDDFGLVGVRALDDRTLEFRLRMVAPYWIFILVIPSQSGADVRRPRGPFRLAHLDPSTVRIEREPRYPRAGGGNVATVEWLRRSRQEANDAILHGDVDVMSQVVPTAPTAQAVAEGRLAAALGAPLMTNYLAFTGIPPLAPDLHLRKAVAHATDRQALAAHLSSNEMTAQGGLVPPGLLGHTPDSALPFDPELARRHLQQSNHRGPLLLGLVLNWQEPFIEPLLDGWRTHLGLEIKQAHFSVRDIASLPSVAHAGLGSWAAGYPDPEYFLHMILHSRSANNATRWSSKTFDTLVDRALAQTTSEARLAFFHEADRLAVQQECSVIPLISTRASAVLQPWVHGWWAWAVPWQSFDQLTVDERSPRSRGLLESTCGYAARRASGRYRPLRRRRRLDGAERAPGSRRGQAGHRRGHQPGDPSR